MNRKLGFARIGLYLLNMAIFATDTDTKPNIIYLK